MAKVKLERDKCIGCGSCAAVCSKYFEMTDDGKSHIIGVAKNDVEELETENLECSQTAADACPMQCIHIEK